MNKFKMSKPIFKVIIILFCLVLPLSLQAGARGAWRFAGYTGQPERLRTFAVYDNKLYVGQDYGGVYRYDGGINWTRIWTVPGNGSAHRFIVWNNQLYLGGYDGWLYQRVNDNQWLQLAKVPNGGGILSLIIYNDQLYAGGENCTGSGSPVYRYQVDDNGWHQVGFFTNLHTIMGLAVYHNRLHASGLGGHVWQYNRDNNWTDLGQVGIGATYALINYQNKLYVGTEGGCLYRYNPKNEVNPRDETWTEVGCIPDWIYTVTIYRNKLYAGTVSHGRVWRWDNGIWTNIGMAGQGCCLNTVHTLIEYNNWLWAGKVDGKVFKYNPWYYPQVDKID